MRSPTQVVFAVLSIVVLSGAVAACSGGGEVGDSCSIRGSVEQCGGDAVCDVDDGSEVTAPTFVCAALCSDASDCGGKETCEPVPGVERMACHPTAAKSD